MSLKKVLILSFFIGTVFAKAQKVSGIYKIGDLLKRIEPADTTYVVNFWATWCKPCVQELPAFDSLAMENKKVKVLLVCLDFKEELDKKVNPFLKKKKIGAECVLLDEINGNDYIDKISPQWSGAIPATLVKRGSDKKLHERKMQLRELRQLTSEK